MESLQPRAQDYLDSLRNRKGTGEKKCSLDWWHGQWQAFANDLNKSPEARALYVDKARAVEIRLRELELERLLDS